MGAKFFVDIKKIRIPYGVKNSVFAAAKHITDIINDHAPDKKNDGRNSLCSHIHSYQLQK